VPDGGGYQRIDAEQERERLKQIVGRYVDEQGGYIIRTAAEGIGESELAQDAAFLKRLWRKIQERRGKYPSCSMLYEDLGLACRIVRDFVGAELDRIRVDSRNTYETLCTFVEEFVPELSGKIEYYHGSSPIFDLYDVENEIQRALDRKVELKSGGYLIIDQTEAMTTRDTTHRPLRRPP